MISGVRYRTMTVTNPLMIAITAAVLLTLSPAAFARDDWNHGDGSRHDRQDIWLPVDLGADPVVIDGTGRRPQRRPRSAQTRYPALRAQRIETLIPSES